MIKFSLRCAQDHSFESWFQSGQAFDALCQRGLVTCPSCGSSDVSKALMAPAVTAAKADIPEPAREMTPEAHAEKLRALRAQIEAQSDYVGQNFAHEARAMYLGDIPQRSIYGEAKAQEAKALLEDGVPVLPLPFMPTRKSN
ncbi:MAG: DUF1178 family protein [Rhodobacteraceae bacterium]|nr:DUF1178 family protein [Paracoccaceae bacterium]